MKKPKYNTEVHRRIVTAIKDGATQKAAARRVGVTPESLSTWKRKHQGFGEDVERAHAAAQVRAETSLYKLAVKGNVRALQAWLQARRPEDWHSREPSALEQSAMRVQVIHWPHEVRNRGSDSSGSGPRP
jgi:transposase-like protein